VFGLLGVLLALALNGAHLPLRSSTLSPRQALLLAALLAVLVAGFDELHQLRLPGRMASWADWLADAAGVALALAGLHKVWR
jgi:VanZ family protein